MSARRAFLTTRRHPTSLIIWRHFFRTYCHAILEFPRFLVSGFVFRMFSGLAEQKPLF